MRRIGFCTGAVHFHLRHVPERIYVTYHYAANDRPRVQQMFLDAGLLDLVVDSERLSGHHKVVVPGEDALARLLTSALMHTLPAPSVHRVMEPTPRELAAARLLHMFVWIHHSHDGHPREGTTYDESNACSGCGNGLRQTSPLVLKQKEIPASGVLGSVGDDVLVHESLAKEIQEAGLTGYQLGDVHDRKGTRLPWHQLFVQHEMPRMTAGSRGLIRGRARDEAPCARCGCDGWFDTASDPFIPAYPCSALAELPDFARTAERFGTGRWSNPIRGRRLLPRARLIVRPAVYAFFRARKIRGIRFSPVAVA
jgi:hypothetical protein